MSKLRSVSTAFWSDPFVEDLTPNQKLLFLYFITNEKTNMLGIYEMSIRKISFETGLKKEEIEKGLKAFERVGKVKYVENYIVLINYLKHQNFNTNMKKAAIDIYNALPNSLKGSEISVSKANPLKGFESLLKHYGMVPKREVEVEVEVKREVEVKKQARDQLILPFDSKEFLAMWTILLQEKKWKGKSNNALQMALKTMSECTEEDAMEMMQNALQGDYQGIFKLKNKNHGKQRIDSNGKAISKYAN